MELQVYCRTQSELNTFILAAANDASAARWTAAQVYSGINNALQEWDRKVIVPYLYTISGGFLSTTFEYTLPDYIDGRVTVQGQRIELLNPGNASSDTVWQDFPAWRIYPNSTGGRTLRLDYRPSDVDARIIWHGRNGPIPISATLPVTNGALSSSSTSLTLTTKPVIARSGYIKVTYSTTEAEWMQYAGYTEAATTITLTNLVRGLFGTTAASKTSGATVEWGTAVHRLDLYQQLKNQVLTYLHLQYLTKASPVELSHHEKQASYYADMVERFWRRYAPPIQGRLRLRRGAVGPGVSTTQWIWVQA